MTWFLAAGGPSIVPRAPHAADPNATQLFFSHNWAAVIGAILCACLLAAWIDNKLKELDDADDDKTPGQKKYPRRGR